MLGTYLNTVSTVPFCPPPPQGVWAAVTPVGVHFSGVNPQGSRGFLLQGWLPGSALEEQGRLDCPLFSICWRK